jgi:hypothetical protein
MFCHTFLEKAQLKKRWLMFSISLKHKAQTKEFFSSHPRTLFHPPDFSFLLLNQGKQKFGF